jgi:hypothetical protein
MNHRALPECLTMRTRTSCVDMHLYLKRGQLPSSHGRLNSSVPRKSMLVQMNLVVEGCELRDTIGSVMVTHMDKLDYIMEGILNVYFLGSLYKPQVPDKFKPVLYPLLF